MLDRRQSARDKVIYGGVAEVGEGGATRECIVRNISENGANLEFSNVHLLYVDALTAQLVHQLHDHAIHVIYSTFIAPDPATAKPGPNGKIPEFVDKGIKHAAFNEAWIRAGD